ncbi:hypothetical protein ABWI01_02050 [Oceanicaulis alexandrii]|uniref:hypothetical protein n=1 Tax=Oceanicaulis alexandrii TaxID=153233 RepID=UPI0035CFB6E9
MSVLSSAACAIALGASLGSGSALAQTEPTFSSAFRSAIGLMLTHEYEEARPIAEQALTLASDPAEHYRARHVLTDISARLGDWQATASYSGEAYAIIMDDPALQGALVLNAAHMAAEEARAATMLNNLDRAADANARMIALHPQAGEGWRAIAPDGAVHDGGLSCPLLSEGLLRFDLLGADDALPGCVYWNLDDVGLRVLDGDGFEAELTRLQAASETTRELEPPETLQALGEQARLFDLGAPTPVSEPRHALVLSLHNAQRTLTLEFPATTTHAALAALSERFADLP